MQLRDKIDNFPDRMFFGAQLEQVDIALNHRFRHAFSLGDGNVSEIEDTVEAAIA